MRSPRRPAACGSSGLAATKAASARFLHVALHGRQSASPGDGGPARALPSAGGPLRPRALEHLATAQHIHRPGMGGGGATTSSRSMWTSIATTCATCRTMCGTTAAWRSSTPTCGLTSASCLWRQTSHTDHGQRMSDTQKSSATSTPSSSPTPGRTPLPCSRASSSG